MTHLQAILWYPNSSLPLGPRTIPSSIPRSLAHEWGEILLNAQAANHTTDASPLLCLRPDHDSQKMRNKMVLPSLYWALLGVMNLHPVAAHLVLHRHRLSPLRRGIAGLEQVQGTVITLPPELLLPDTVLWQCSSFFQTVFL